MRGAGREFDGYAVDFADRAAVVAPRRGPGRAGSGHPGQQRRDDRAHARGRPPGRRLGPGARDQPHEPVRAHAAGRAAHAGARARQGDLHREPAELPGRDHRARVHGGEVRHRRADQGARERVGLRSGSTSTPSRPATSPPTTRRRCAPTRRVPPPSSSASRQGGGATPPTSGALPCSWPRPRPTTCTARSSRSTGAGSGADQRARAGPRGKRSPVKGFIEFETSPVDSLRSPRGRVGPRPVLARRDTTCGGHERRGDRPLLPCSGSRWWSPASSAPGVRRRPPGEGTPADPDIAFVGRWNRSSAEAVPNWAGAYLHGFTGTTVKQQRGTVDLWAGIDGGEFVAHPNVSGTVDLTPTPLRSGTHTLGSARQVAGSYHGDAVFTGLTLDAGAQTSRPPAGRSWSSSSATPSPPARPAASSPSPTTRSSRGSGSACDHTQIAIGGMCLARRRSRVLGSRAALPAHQRHRGNPHRGTISGTRRTWWW